MRFKLIPALAATAAFLPFVTQAEGLSYSYADLAYVSTDFDGFGDEVDGLALRGSFEIVERLFVFAGYTDQDASGPDVDYQTFNLGVGYAWPLGQALDLYGKVGYANAEVDAGPFGDIDDDGYLLAVGLRGRAVEQLELEGALSYVDLSDWGDDTSLDLAARWYFTPQFAAGVEGSFGDDADTFGIGVRWNFGN
jgi:hypothetical protein